MLTLQEMAPAIHSGLPSNGLVALYDPYRDAYGLDATARAALQTGTDYSGHGNTLTYGANTNASTDDPTNTGTAWSFDGGDYLGLPSGLSVVSLSGAYTALSVFKTSQATNGSGVWQIVNASGDRNAVGFSNGGFFGFTTYNGTIYRRVVSAGTISADTWYCAVGRCAANALKLSVGASTYTTNTDSVLIGIGASGRQIGVASTLYLTGQVALQAFWNRQLSDAEVSRSYARMKSLMALRGVTLA